MAAPQPFLDLPFDTPFPLQNLPYGIFSPRAGATPRPGVRFGDWVLDLAQLSEAGLFTGPYLAPTDALQQPTLNDFMALGRPAWQEARRTLQELLTGANPLLKADEGLHRRTLHRIGDVEMHLPATIGDYTDFYSSLEHATNVGKLFRPDQPLLPNWRHLPVAYHGRASSVVVSGQDVHRPRGQSRPAGNGQTRFGPSREVDFELEVGYFIGPGNRLGEPIPVEQAEEHIFGLVLVNDWSARDIQRWEYRPLGPFLGKNFATTISPWVVTLEALAPFRVAGPAQSPQPLPYLRHSASCAYDVQLRLLLEGAEMESPAVVARSNFRYLYWTMCQQVAHHAVGGCNLRPGDLLASGTISGPTPDSYGSLLELTRGGDQMLSLPGGEKRTFLHDGDRVTLQGWCQGDSYRIGFGEATARLLSPL